MDGLAVVRARHERQIHHRGFGCRQSGTDSYTSQLSYLMADHFLRLRIGHSGRRKARKTLGDLARAMEKRARSIHDLAVGIE